MVKATDFSSLAKRVSGVRDPNRDGVTRTPWGLAIHTTGGGVTDKARREGRRPIDVAIAEYIKSQNGSNRYPWGGPTYVMDHDGTLYQIAPDSILTHHSGGPHAADYRSGTWINQVSAATVQQWRKQWPNNQHPYTLFPGGSPNYGLVGLEMIPIGDGFGGKSMRPGLRFTTAQHNAVVALARDLAVRHRWPVGWNHTSRLLGHEDVDPIERHDAGGGWDPGWLRAAPYFDFGYVRQRVGETPATSSSHTGIKILAVAVGLVGLVGVGWLGRRLVDNSSLARWA